MIDRNFSVVVMRIGIVTAATAAAMRSVVSVAMRSGTGPVAMISGSVLVIGSTSRTERSRFVVLQLGLLPAT
jgi:exonuclease VII large subunit